MPANHTKTKPAAQFGLGKSIAFSLILIALTLTVAEVAVRGWAYYLRDTYQRFDASTKTFVLIPGEHRTRAGTIVIDADGFAGRELQAPGPDLWRIVAVGDSCTFAAGDTSGTYSAMAEDELRASRPHPPRYEVVNAGIEGLNSELALRRFRSKVLPLEPDVVTIYIGWNDLMKVDPLAQDARLEWSGAARFLGHFWLIRGLRKLIFFYLRPLLAPPRTGDESFTGQFHSFRPTVFEANLRSLIEEARGANASPLVFTLPSVIRADMTGEDLRRAHVIFPYFQSAYGVGDFIDLIAAYNRSIREIARDESVPILDLAEEFQSLPDVGRHFYDVMHTTKSGQAFIASKLVAKLAQENLLGPRPSERSRSRAAYEASHRADAP